MKTLHREQHSHPCRVPCIKKVWCVTPEEKAVLPFVDDPNQLFGSRIRHSRKWRSRQNKNQKTDDKKVIEIEYKSRSIMESKTSGRNPSLPVSWLRYITFLVCEYLSKQSTKKVILKMSRIDSRSKERRVDASTLAIEPSTSDSRHAGHRLKCNGFAPLCVTFRNSHTRLNTWSSSRATMSPWHWLWQRPCGNYRRFSGLTARSSYSQDTKD